MAECYSQIPQRTILRTFIVGHLPAPRSDLSTREISKFNGVFALGRVRQFLGRIGGDTQVGPRVASLDFLTDGLRVTQEESPIRRARARTRRRTKARHCVILRFAKWPSMPGPTNRATAPSESPSFISLTIRQRLEASCKIPASVQAEGRSHS
jgi:hypothetical protein